jgi:hypothetical protein
MPGAERLRMLDSGPQLPRTGRVRDVDECVGRLGRGCDVMAACDLPKVDARVRFPPPAPGLQDQISALEAT